MDFSRNEDQRALVELAGSIFADRCQDDQIRAFAEGDAAFDEQLWAIVAEAGLTGIGIAEDRGGHGFGMVETALVLEQAGSALAPIPLRETLTAAQTLAALSASPDLVADAVSGGAVLTTACDEIGAAFYSPDVAARRDGNGWALSGTKLAVPYGNQASAMLLSASLPDGGAGLFVVDAENAGVAREPQRGTDMTPLASLELNDASLPAEALLGGEEGADEVLRNHIGRCRVALSASQLGIAGEALRRVAAYTAERVQFGRPIGSMQAVQQRAADGYIDVEAMRSTCWRAAWLIDQGQFDMAEIGAAKYWAAMGGHRVTHTAQHQHGGMGADVTYPIHRFFLAAKHVGSALGGAQPVLAEIGDCIAAGGARKLSAIGGGHDAV